jgi:DNA gyrase subunit A
LIPQEETMVMLTEDGYIKRLPPDTFRTQARGGKGVVGLATKEENINYFFHCLLDLWSLDQYILFMDCFP